MTVIDLGEVTSDEAVPAVPLDHRRVLRATLALLSLAGVVLLAGSAHGTPAGVRRLWTQQYRDSDTIAMDGRNAYVGQSSGGPHLAAYDLDTGKLRWTARTGREVTDYAPRLAGDILLAPADPLMITQEEPDGSRYAYETVRSTVALDAVTGRELWRTDGDATPTAAGDTALVAAHDEQGRTVRLRLVRLRDGGEIWSRSVPPLTGWTPLPGIGRPTAVVTATADGEINIYGYADGGLRTSGHLAPDPRARWASLIAEAGYLAVIRGDEAQEIVTTVYRSDDLKPLWKTRFALPCGALLCSQDSSGISAHDPLSGRVLWTAPGTQDIRVVGDDRIMLGVTLDGTRWQLAELRTGRPIGGPVAGVLTEEPDPDGSVLLLRPSVDPVGRLVVTRLDIAGGRLDTLGSLVGTTEEAMRCSAIPGYLACPLADGLHLAAVG